MFEVLVEGLNLLRCCHDFGSDFPRLPKALLPRFLGDALSVLLDRVTATPSSSVRPTAGDEDEEEEPTETEDEEAKLSGRRHSERASPPPAQAFALEKILVFAAQSSAELATSAAVDVRQPAGGSDPSAQLAALCVGAALVLLGWALEKAPLTNAEWEDEVSANSHTLPNESDGHGVLDETTAANAQASAPWESLIGGLMVCMTAY